MAAVVLSLHVGLTSRSFLEGTFRACVGRVQIVQRRYNDYGHEVHLVFLMT